MSAALPSNSVWVMTRALLSSAIDARTTTLVVGASFTGVTVMFTVATLEANSPSLTR